MRPALRFKQLWFEELRADLALVQRRTGEPVLDYAPRHRLGKRNFRLVFEPL